MVRGQSSKEVVAILGSEVENILLYLPEASLRSRKFWCLTRTLYKDRKIGRYVSGGYFPVIIVSHA